MQGLGRPSPIGLKHSAIALSGDSEPITHLHTPPARGVQGCARVCKWVQHSPLVASLRAAPATQRDRCGSPRCVDRRHTEPSAGQSDAAQRRIDAESPAGQFAGTGRAYRPHSGQGVQGCARVCKGCSSTAWPAPSSPSSAKCAQSDSASIGHVTGLSGYAALDLFEWASARSPTM